MAIIQYRLGSFENEQAVVYMEYDDISMRVSAIVCVNNLPNPVYAALIRNSDRRIYTQNFPPGTTTLSIPTQGQGRVEIVNLGRGHWGNISIQMGYPA